MNGWFVRAPSSATRFQFALAGVDAARLAAIEIPIATLWNPQTCPAHLLSHLAWALSVDIWDDDWTTARKRRVIAAAPMVHRLKGTRGAVERALAAFDLKTNIIEWWEDGSRHGTFRVEILYEHGGPSFDTQTQVLAINAVAAAKPKARVFTTRAIIRSRSPLYIGAVSRTVLAATVHPFYFDPPVLRAGVYPAAASASFLSSTAHPKD